MTAGDPVATWCVAMRDKGDGGEKTVHVKCPQYCDSYTSGSAGVLGLCIDSGPECLIFGVVSVVLLIITLLTMLAAVIPIMLKIDQLFY